jgi:hypothetical protein
MTRVGEMRDVQNALDLLSDFDPERFEVERDSETVKVTDSLDGDAVVMSALRTPNCWVIRYSENYFGD